MDGAGIQRRLDDHRLRRRVLVQRRLVVVDVHRRHVDGDVGDGDRSDQRHGLHVPRLGGQRRRHRRGIGDSVGDPAHRARRTDRVDGDAGFDPGDPVVDGAGSHRRLGDHRLRRRVLVQRRFVVVDVHRRHVDGDVGDGHRSDQRDGLHVPRLGGQRRRHRRASTTATATPSTVVSVAQCADRVDGDAGFDPGGPVVDGAGSQRRLGDHRLPRRVLGQRRYVMVDVQRRHVDGDVGDGHRSDQRHGLHVPRLGGQRRRHRSSIGDRIGNPEHRVRCTDRTGGDRCLPANGSAPVRWRCRGPRRQPTAARRSPTTSSSTRPTAVRLGRRSTTPRRRRHRRR